MTLTPPLLDARQHLRQNVIKIIKKLIRDGYLRSNIYPVIELSSKGKEMAHCAKKRHLILSEFLIRLGVPEPIATADVEGIEHHVSPKTLNALESHLKTLRSINEDELNDNSKDYEKIHSRFD